MRKQKIDCKQEIRILRVGEISNEEVEEYQIEVNGNRYNLSHTNHDEEGWSGMEAARDVVETIADLMGIEIEEDFNEDT